MKEPNTEFKIGMHTCNQTKTKVVKHTSLDVAIEQVNFELLEMAEEEHQIVSVTQMTETGGVWAFLIVYSFNIYINPQK